MQRPTPWSVARHAIRRPPGSLALRTAIATKLREENGLGYEPKQVIVTCGAKHAIFNALAVTVEPEDEVLIPAPYWVSYP